MGSKASKLGGHAVDPSHLCPQGLYPLRDVDLKRLKRYILTGRLAPCFPGQDDDSVELEECPICLMHYPCLNQALCCSKGICTECFLQVQVRNKRLPGALCPYCKASLMVVFRGPKSEVERSHARLEEERVLQALALARLAEDAAAAEQAEQRRALPKQRCMSMDAETEQPSAPHKGRVSAAHLVHYIPCDILQSGGGTDHLDLNDAMLLQALQASLADQHNIRSSHRRRSHRKPSQPSSTQRVSSAWQNATERFTRSRVHPMGGPASPCQPPRELLESMLSEGPPLSEGALVASGGADSLILDSSPNVGPSQAGPEQPDCAARSHSESRAHPLRTHLLRSGEWANNSALSTVSSTSMEVLLSAAADFSQAIYDSGGSASPAASPEQQQAQEPDRALLDTSWSVRTASTLSPIAEAEAEARACPPASSRSAASTPMPAAAAPASTPPPLHCAPAAAQPPMPASGPLAAASTSVSDAQPASPAQASRPGAALPQLAPPAVPGSPPEQIGANARQLQQPAPAQPCTPPERCRQAGPAQALAPAGWNLQRGCLVKGSGARSAAPENSSSASNAGWPAAGADAAQAMHPPASSRRGQHRSISCSATRAPELAGSSAALFPGSQDDQACFKQDITVGMVFTDFLPWRSSRQQSSMASRDQPQRGSSASQASREQHHHIGLSGPPAPQAGGSSAQLDQQLVNPQAAPAGDGSRFCLNPEQSPHTAELAERISSGDMADVPEGNSPATSSDAGPARSFKLSQDGGAVLMQNPDGTEALMLLVSDLKRAKEDLERKEKAAQAERDRAPLGSYEAPATEHDRAVRDAINWADQALQRLYAGPSSQGQPAAPGAQQPSPAVTASPEAWLEKARQQDLALTAALNQRDAEALHRISRAPRAADR